MPGALLFFISDTQSCMRLMSTTRTYYSSGCNVEASILDWYKSLVVTEFGLTMDIKYLLNSCRILSSPKQPLTILVGFWLWLQKRLRQAFQKAVLSLVHSFSYSLSLSALSAFAAPSLIAFLYFILQRIRLLLISPLRGRPRRICR